MSNLENLSEKDMGQISTYQSGIAQASAHRVINRVVSDFLVRYDLTAMQWFIIGYINDAGSVGLTIGDICQVIDTTLPYTTNTINLLESKGIVNKRVHSKDSRIKIVTLDPTHKAMVEEIEEGLRDELRKTLYATDRISRDELQTYIHVLYKIIAADKQ